MQIADWIRFSGLPLWAVDFGAALILGALLGLVLSFVFRTKPWIVLVWVPTVGTIAGAIFRIVSRIVWLGHLRGPEAIGGIELVFLLPVLLAWIVCLIICGFAWPRKAPGRWYFFGPAILMYILVPRLVTGYEASSIRVVLSGLQGEPLADVPVRLRINSTSEEQGAEVLVTKSDDNGAFGFKLERYHSAGLRLDPRWSGRGHPYDALMAMEIGFSLMKASDHQLLVTQSWQHSFYDKYVPERFSQVIPAARDMEFHVQVRPQHSFEPGVLSGEIHDALIRLQTSNSAELSYGYVCDNFDSIEFIPVLIDTYRRYPEKGKDVIEALSEVAAMLSNMDSGCRFLRRNALNPFTPRDYVAGSLADEIHELRKWAKLEPSPAEDVLGELERVRGVIAARAQVIITFAFNERLADRQLAELLGKLGPLGQPAIPQIIQELIANSPANAQDTHLWSRCLWSIGAHANELSQLSGSGNPLLVLLVYDAAENDLRGSAAKEFLAKLKAVRSTMPDRNSAMLADTEIKMLERWAGDTASGKP